MNKTKAAIERFQKTAMPNQQALYGMALKLTHNDRDAEDLVQDILIKAYNHFDSYEDGTNCRAWLFRILTNTFINKYRRSQRERAYIDSVVSEAVKELPCDTHTPDKELSELAPETQKSFFFSLSDEVLKALNAVSDEFKSILIMADLQEFSYKEIAERLHIPIGTVMSRLCRGRRLMRTLLSDYASNYGYVTK